MPGAAAHAGLRQRRGARIGGRRAGATAQQLRELIRVRTAPAAAPASAWTMERDGRGRCRWTRPRRRGEGPAEWVIGAVGSAAGDGLVRHGPMDGLWPGWFARPGSVGLSLRMLGRMLVGEASLKNLSGPLTIADYAGKSGQPGDGLPGCSWP